MIPTLIGITAVVFFTMAAAPGSIGGTLLDEAGELDAAQARAMREYYEERYGLHDPAYVQYARWLNNISPLGRWTQDPDEPAGWASISLGTTDDGEAIRFGFKTPDLGESFSRGRPVTELFRDRLPITILLNALSIPIVYLIAVVIGIYAARHRGGSFDVGSGATMLALWAVPTIWAGVLLIGFLANEQYLRWFPASGISHRDAEEWAFLPTAGAFGQTVAFGVYVLLNVAVIFSLAILAVSALITLFSGMARVLGRGETDPRTPAKVALWCLMIFVPAAALLWVGASATEILPDRMPGSERGWLVDRLWHLTLPVVCLAYSGFAFLSKLMRSSMLENLSQDFVRTARAKGIAENVVLWRHVFRNSLLPLITVGALILPAMLGGSVIVERIFSIPGMGDLMIQAIFDRDRELVLGAAFVGGILGLVALLIADLAYAIADPRVSYE